MQATSPIPLVPWCCTYGAPAPAANTNNPVNTEHGRTIHNGTLLQNFIFGHGTGLQEFSVSGNKLVTGSYNLFLRSWDRASLMYLSINNKMQRYTVVFITINVLHVSGGSSAHHQELKTVYTASGICRAFTANRQIPDAVYTVSSS
jgi:WD40 repeat protein